MVYEITYGETASVGMRNLALRIHADSLADACDKARDHRPAGYFVRGIVESNGWVAPLPRPIRARAGR